MVQLIEFEDLSNDILLSIFENVDNRGLSALAYVNERFRSLIANSSSIMKRFQLSYRFKARSFGEVEEIPGGNYQNLQMNVDYFKDEKIDEGVFDKIEACKSFIRNADFGYLKLSNVVELIENCPKLSKLLIVDVKSFDEEIDKIAHLPSLKHFTLYNSIHVLKHVKPCNLEIFKLFGIQKFAHEDLAEEIMDRNLEDQARKAERFSVILNDFLRSCESLKELYIQNTTCNLTFDVPSWPFHLHTLTLDRLSLDDETLKMLLMQQRSSLKKLAVREAWSDDFRQSLNFALFDLNLDYLEWSSLSTDPRNIFINRVNKSIKTLSLHFSAEVFGDVKQVIQACEGVENLRVYQIKKPAEVLPLHADLISEVSLSMKNLKALKISRLPSVIPQAISLDKVEKIEVVEIESEEEAANLFGLLELAPNLQEVSARILDEIFNLEDFQSFIESSVKATKINLEVFKRALTKEYIKVLNNVSNPNWFFKFPKDGKIETIEVKNRSGQICQLNRKMIHKLKPITNGEMLDTAEELIEERKVKFEEVKNEAFYYMNEGEEGDDVSLASVDFSRADDEQMEIDG